MMWSRQEIKEKGKSAFKNNFWKTVLVSLLLVIIGGGGVFGGSSGVRTVYNIHDTSSGIVEESSESYDFDDNMQDVEDFEVSENVQESEGDTFEISGTMGLFLILAVLAVFAVVIWAIQAFILGPLEIGFRRFFIRNLNEQARIHEIGYGFDHNYIENVKTMFFKELYTMLWSFLLVIPGIVKAYEYRMIPYLLADDETMTRQEAFKKSKEMMMGQKWNAFVLDLSFIGWDILSLFTLGILGVFHVNPYRNMSQAALYHKLRYGTVTQESTEEFA